MIHLIYKYVLYLILAIIFKISPFPIAGDIGVACSKLASAYGMNIIALRRNPQLSQNDETLDKVCVTFFH
jgi:hypothetical protein